MVEGTWKERGIRSPSSDTSTEGTEGEEDINDITANASGDKEIVNKFNDFTHYWADEETKDEHRMSGDTPDVRIYISRQVIPEDVEESLPNEEGESYIRRGEDPDFNRNNTVALRDENGNYIYGHKELDEEWVKEATAELKKLIDKYGADGTRVILR